MQASGAVSGGEAHAVEACGHSLTGQGHEADARVGAGGQMPLAATDAQRAALLEARSEGTISSRALNDTQQILDLEEARIEQVSDRVDGD